MVCGVIEVDAEWLCEVLMKLVRGELSKRRFEAFIADAADVLFRTGYLMTGDSGTAEDLVQETFIRVARRWDQVQSMDHPLAYARRVLVNLAVDGAERRSRQRAELASEQGWAEPADHAAARSLGEVEDLAEFRWALAKLPPREQAVLMLRYWADLPTAEVAAVLGCSAGTVKSTASRGAARLATILSRDRLPAGQPGISARGKGITHDCR
jgi:RNA polymerase sigma-70 factor (sigma-E family)